MATTNNNINFIWGEPMKKSILLLLLLATTFAFANDKVKSNYSSIEENLLVGVASDNLGLKLSSAYFLGEIKSDKAIIPLLEILHNADECCARQVAALSLFKIDSERGMFAIKQAIKFDNDEQTRRLCQIFYNYNLVKNLEGNVEVEPIYSKLDLTFGEYKLRDFDGS